MKHKSRTPKEYLAYVKARDLRRAERHKRERELRNEKRLLSVEFDYWLQVKAGEKRV